MRIFAAFAALLVLTACSAGATQKARVAAHNDLSAIQAVQRTIPGKSGVPVSIVFVSGTITNTDPNPMKCSPSSFLLVDGAGNAVAPQTQWCDAPSIAPSQSAFFNATFTAKDLRNVQLRFVHPDGSYEVHDLILPPA